LVTVALGAGLTAGSGSADATRAATAWDRPVLSHPSSVLLSWQNRDVKLNDRKDYVIRCPPGPDNMSGGPIIAGGHNVILDGCDINVDGQGGGLELEDQTGKAWVHDLHISGSQLLQGIDLQDPQATVVLRDVLVDTVHGSHSTNHAELIQTWAGPRRLLIDGFDGSTTYQGFFLLPNQWYGGPAPRLFDLRHVYIDDSQGAEALWLGDVTGGLSALRLNVSDVYVKPNPARRWRGWWLWPQPSGQQRTWAQVSGGQPPGGPYVQASYGGAFGVDEGVSPAPLAPGLP